MAAAREANEMDATRRPEPSVQPGTGPQSEDYEVPVDPHDGVDCEDCQ